MILRIDHVALSSSDIAADGMLLEKKGFHKVFSGTGIDNPEIKRGLMARFPRKHDAALYTFPGGLPVEIINHGHSSGSPGYIRPMPSDSSGFDTIEAETADALKSSEFWKMFGFRQPAGKAAPGQEGGGIRALEFRPVLPGPGCTIIMRETGGGSRHFLDDKGYNCLAFVSNSVRREKEALEKAGIKTTGIQKFVSNGRELEIMFAAGPSGELVEIIGPRQGD